MSPRTDRDAAYYTLLRAREEYERLLRYQEWLEAERSRLDAFTEATREHDDEAPPALRKSVEATTKPTLEAIGRRRNAVDAEATKVPDRLAAAQSFVDECEAEVARLRG